MPLAPLPREGGMIGARPCPRKRIAVAFGLIFLGKSQSRGPEPERPPSGNDLPALRGVT
jgi:hypothetical protein